MKSRRRAPALEPAAIRELPLPGIPGLRVCFALPPRRAGRLRLGEWWPSFGAGLTLGEARRKARAEALERACAVFRGDEPRTRASFRGLRAQALDPSSWLLWSARQRRARVRKRRVSPLLRIPPAFDATAPLDWSTVRSLTTGGEKYVPTMALYFRYPVLPRRRFCPADSNGLAAGPTRTAATLAALLELIERDSVALWWYNRTRRPAVKLDEEAELLLSWYRHAGREAWLLDLTSDLGIPVVAAISRRAVRRSGGRVGGDDLAFGFGAGVTMAAAARHALLEMAQVLAVRAAGWRGGAGTAPFERWCVGARAQASPHLLPQGKRRPLTALPEAPGAALLACRERLARRGLEVLMADLTRSEVALPVVRVLVPGLRHLWPRLAPGRLYEAPVRAGWRRTPLPESRLNPVPLLL